MLRLLNILSALVALFICMFFQQRICGEFTFIICVPIIYLIFSSILEEVIRKKKKSVYRTTGILLIALQWLRCVLMPALGTVCGYYADIGEHMNSGEAPIAVGLLIYEMVAVFLFAIIVIHYSGREKDAYNGNLMTLFGDKKLYVIFIIFAFGLMIVTGIVPFQFFALSSGTSTRLALNQDKNIALETVIMYGLTFLVIVVIARMHQKYLLTKRELYVNIALCVVVVRISLISSESRLALLYQIGTGLMLMTKLFPEQRRKIVRTLVIVAVAVVGLLTIYKVFYAFMYASYREALAAGSDFNLMDLSSMLDSYFYGVKTIGRNLTYARSASDATFMRWLMDTVRNTFGIHYLFKGNIITTLEAYNLYLYGGAARSGHLFSSIAYGYLYYGTLFAPLSTIFNFMLACFMEKRIRSIRYIEVYYIMCMTYVRFAVSQFSFFGATWNYVSRTIAIGMLVIGLASIARIRPSSKIHIDRSEYSR